MRRGQWQVGRTPSSAPDPLVRLFGRPDRPTGGSAADQGVRPTKTAHKLSEELIGGAFGLLRGAGSVQIGRLNWFYTVGPALGLTECGKGRLERRLQPGLAAPRSVKIRT
jgi:hypothetical protein